MTKRQLSMSSYDESESIYKDARVELTQISQISQISQVINISSSSTFDGVYDKPSVKRNVHKFRHDQVPQLIEKLLSGEFLEHHILNFDCCGGCSECGHNQWVFNSEEISYNCMQLIEMGLQRGWTIYISDFALKAFISGYNLNSNLGECPFIMNHPSHSGGMINIQFRTDISYDGPFEQLRLLTEPTDNVGTAQIELVGGTIIFELNPEIIQRNAHRYTITTQATTQSTTQSTTQATTQSTTQATAQATDQDTSRPIICEIHYTQYPGKINAYGCHLSKLTFCNTSEERILRSLNFEESQILQSELASAGNNQELRMSSIQKMASQNISSF